jgi:FolB domain-containing protein
VIGCHAHERLKPQTLNLNLKLSLPELKARQSDVLADTVNYGELARCLTQKASQTEYFLIEKLAQVLVDTCLEFDARIQSVELELEKPGCIENAKSAVIKLTQP